MARVLRTDGYMKTEMGRESTVMTGDDWSGADARRGALAGMEGGESRKHPSGVWGQALLCCSADTVISNCAHQNYDTVTYLLLKYVVWKP